MLKIEIIVRGKGKKMEIYFINDKDEEILVGVVKYRPIYKRSKTTKYTYSWILTARKPLLSPWTWSHVVDAYQGIKKEAQNRFPNDRDPFLAGNITLQVTEGVTDVMCW